jgi:DNA-binding CsgD family transcriptional regulator
VPALAQWIHGDASGARLVGRDRELAQIAAARTAGDCAGVVLVGQAGVGKTRVARAALVTAAEDGAAFEWAQATRSAATIPLAAFVGLLPQDSLGHDPLQLFKASTAAMLSRANGRPAVLGLDDAHLLDGASAALALHLASTGAAFVVATVRAGESCPDAIVALWKDAGARRMELAALCEADTVALAEELLGGQLEGVAAHWAFASSAGNALYLRELVASALETGALSCEDGLWRLRRKPAPGAALAELVAQRLEGLDEPERELLAMLSLGEPLTVDVLSSLASAETLEDVERRGLVAVERTPGGPSARLAHPLFGEVTRAVLSGAHADDLRVRLADAVRARGLGPGDAVRVATWLLEARQPVEPALLATAAGEAYRAADPQLTARLAELAEAAGVGPEATLMLGHAQAMLGLHEESERTFARLEASLRGAAEAGRAPSLELQEQAVAYLFARLRTLTLALGRGDDAERVVARAAEWWPDEGWRRRVEGMRLAALAMNGRMREAGELADEVAADPQLPAAMAPIVDAAGAVGWAFAGETAKAKRIAERALPSPPADEQLTDSEMGALFAWSSARLVSGRDWPELESRLARIEQAAVHRGDRGLAGVAACTLGCLALFRGTPAVAARGLREALAHLELRDPHDLLFAAALELAQANAMLGRLDAARGANALAHAHLGGRPPTSHEQPWIARAEGWIAAAAGEQSRAVEVLHAAAEDTARWPPIQAELAHEALSAGGAARDLAPLLAEAAGRCDAPLAAAYAEHAAALAEGDAARLERVAGELSAIGAWLAAAEAAAQAAALHAGEGRASSARRAAALSARLHGECEGAATPALRATDPRAAALTRREREVAELAAAGRSNAEIADQLTISVRTVESHLYHAMVKLGAGRRDELPTHLRHFAGFTLPG